jgi:putative transposase
LIETEKVFVHEIGGTETHIHVVVTIPPMILVSDSVGQLKGASSHEVNQQVGFRGKTLQWQTGYGVVSFGTGDLEWVTAYVRNQRQRHAEGKISERLEQITAQDENRSPVNGRDRIESREDGGWETAPPNPC